MPRILWTLRQSRHPLTGSRAFPKDPHITRWGIPGAALAAILMLLGTAMAQAPPNDDITAATVIPAVPFTDANNTTEATTAADDPDCEGQGPTVWYSFTPDADGYFGAHTFGSDYDTTLSVYTGTPGNLTQIACNDDVNSLQSAVIFNAVAGETYFLMVGPSPADLGVT